MRVQTLVSEVSEVLAASVVSEPSGCRCSNLVAMFFWLFVALLCVPLLELYVIIQVAGGIGTGQTILLLVAVSVVGAWMVRRSGIGVLNQLRRRLSAGEMPGAELVDGMLILIAGAFMLTPGFLTDAVGLTLLFPPTRIIVRTLLIRRFASRITAHRWTVGTGNARGHGLRSDDDWDEHS